MVETGSDRGFSQRFETLGAANLARARSLREEQVVAGDGASRVLCFVNAQCRSNLGAAFWPLLDLVRALL